MSLIFISDRRGKSYVKACATPLCFNRPWSGAFYLPVAFSLPKAELGRRPGNSLERR